MSPMDPNKPTRTDIAFFSDEEELSAPGDASTGAELAGIFRSLLRADLGGVRPGAVLQCIQGAKHGDRLRLVHGLCDALADDQLVSFIEASDERRRKAIDIVVNAAPPDPSLPHNYPALSALSAFSEWDHYKYSVIIVPGYTPLDTKKPSPGVHPVARRRLEQAVKDASDKMAPFILVTGGNVYPRGTPYYEAIEMKKALVAMGFPGDRILVEARARHSTTNLRNAGRIMLDSKLASAVITTGGGGVLGSDLFDQDFYFSNPTLSTFHLRCEKQLGYRVGELSGAGPRHTELTPSPSVRRINYRDPLDP